MNKKELTEADIRTKFITPALIPPSGKWDLMSQLREEVYFTEVSSSRTDIRGLGREGVGLLSVGGKTVPKAPEKGELRGLLKKLNKIVGI